MEYLPAQVRRSTWWAALVMVLVGVALLAFSLGRSVAPPTAPSEERLLAEGAEVADLALPPEGDPPASSDVAAPPGAAVAPTPGLIVVYISGAVHFPDTYSMPADARVKDLVLAAGGLADDADAARINLSEHISDAQHIHVPQLGTSSAAPEAQAAPEGQAQGDGLVNLNSAGAAEIEGLPRIGQALAQRIVDWRSVNGPFQALADVQKVKGISPSVYEAIKELVTVD